MKTKSRKEILREVTSAISAVSKITGKLPIQVTVTDLQEHGVSERQLRNLGGLPLIKKALFPVQDKDLNIVHGMKRDSAYVSKLEKRLADKLAYEDTIADTLGAVKSVKVVPYKGSKNKKIKRELNLVLSDLHFGSDINGEETGNITFGTVEESRRIAFVTKEVIDYKAQYRDETKLNVMLLGDIIQNQLHDPRDGAPLAEQAARAINLLNQVFAQLSANFPSVSIYCATGNHGRNTRRHEQRATNQKWDSIETIIYYAIKESCKALTNVKVVIPKTPYVSYEVFGKKIFATHGDSVLKPGYPGQAIKTGSLEGQFNKINASLKDKEEYSVAVIGHVHVGSVTHLSNGVTMITNGALVPTDEFAVSIGLLESTAGQYIFESVEGYPVGDVRFIKVGKVQDTDASLDKIIKPYEGL